MKRFGTQPGSPDHLDRPGRAYQRWGALAERVPWLTASAPYNLTVADEPPFVWYRVAKVGTVTIHRHLAKHATLRIDQPFQARIPRSAHAGHFHFAFVRNPWERLVSCWEDKVLERDHFGLGADIERLRASFPAFVDHIAQWDLDRGDPHVRRQATLIDLDRVDFIGRFEHFGHDLATVCRRLGVPADFGHGNPTAHDHYSLYYDDRTAEAVGRIYEHDARLFGYRFEAAPDAKAPSVPDALRPRARED